MSSGTFIVILSLLWTRWPRSVGQFLDSPSFTDTISISITTTYTPTPSTTTFYTITSTPITYTVTPSITPTPTTTIFVTSSAYYYTCPPVTEFVNGTYEYESDHLCDPITIGCTVKYTCDEGYTLYGAKSAVCHADGWHKPQPVCIPISCGIPFISDGTADGDLYTYGNEVNFTCNPDYYMEGSNTSICQANGSWSEIPTCTYMCPVPTLHNGTVDYDCLDVGCIVNYTCDTGFNLEGSTTQRCIEGVGWSGTDPYCVEDTTEEVQNLQLTFATVENDDGGIDLDDPNVEEDVYNELLKKLRRFMGDRIRALRVDNIYPNGTIDFLVVTDADRETIQDLSSAFGAIARGENFNITGLNVNSYLSVLDGKTVYLSDPSSVDQVACETLEYLDGPCPAETPCNVLNTIPDCRPLIENAVDLLTILLLSVDIPVLLAAICLCTCSINVCSGSDLVDLLTILLLAVGIPVLLLAISLCTCCICFCCCAAPVAEEEEYEEPKLVRGFLPRYLHAITLPVRFNNEGPLGSFYPPSGADAFSSPPLTSTVYSSSSKGSRGRSHSSSNSNRNAMFRPFPRSNFQVPSDDEFYRNPAYARYRYDDRSSDSD